MRIHSIGSDKGISIRTYQAETSAQEPLSIWVNGPCLRSNSIGEVLRHIVLALHDQGIVVRWDSSDQGSRTTPYRGLLEDLRGGPVGRHVQLVWGSPAARHQTALTAGTICLDCSDSFRPWVPEVVQQYQSAETTALLCFSAGCRDHWERAGVPARKLVVMPLGVDCHLYRPAGRKYDWAEVDWQTTAPEPGAKVFVVAGYLQHRKGVAETVEAFCRAFRGRRDVALVCKTVAQDWGERQDKLVTKVLRRAGAGDDLPPIGLLTGDLPVWDFAALLRSAHCVVNAHRMEGFGMIPLQALACGTQIIVTDYHGPREYATADNAWLLPVTGEVAPPSGMRGLPEALRWADYDLDALADLMLKAAEQPRSPEAGLATARAMSWARTAAIIRDVIEGRLGPVRRRPARWYVPGLYSLCVAVRDTPPAMLERTVRTFLDLAGERGEVILADDHSGDDTAAACKQLAEADERVRSERMSRHMGAFACRRRLCAMARGEWIIIADSDLDFGETRRDALDLLSRLWQERSACIVHPLLTYPDGNVESAGGMVDSRSGSACLHRYRGAAPCGEVLTPRPVAYGSSAFQMFHASLLDWVQYCDEYFPAYFGDPDFCYLARAATGRQVWYCPEVRVTHDAHTWTASHRAGARYGVCQQIFLRRWGAEAAEDLRQQDETGALRIE